MTYRRLASPLLLGCTLVVLMFGCSSSSDQNSPGGNGGGGAIGVGGYAGLSSGGLAGASGLPAGAAGLGQGGAQNGQGGNAQATLGGAQTGQGGAQTGQGGAQTDQGGAQTGQGGAQTSQGGAQNGQGGATTTACTFTIDATPSSVIPTVGVVQWSTTLSSVSSAHIDFGLTTNYGMTAPVDLTEANYKTLLLGMKASQTYHFRIVAEGGGQQCSSDDQSIQTGPLATNLPKPTVTTSNAQALAGGFLVSEVFQAGTAFILDADGDIVWWYQPDIGDLSRIRMSYDGKYMWMGHGNVPKNSGQMVRVLMDGTNPENLSDQFSQLNHDFAVLPDETIIYIAYGSNSNNGCDDVIERSPDGTLRTIINSQTPFGDGQPCHCNAIQYSPDDDTVVVSELDHDAYFKVDRQGQVVWILGGNASYNDFTGTGSTWDNEHGLHVLGLDRLLIFNNGANGGGAGGGSKAIEIQLDLSAWTATNVWEYAGQNGGSPISNNIMGSVQRLDNGNTLVTYSTQGIIHEVDANLNLLQELSWGLGGAVGYATKRASLYGPPPW